MQPISHFQNYHSSLHFQNITPISRNLKEIASKLFAVFMEHFYLVLTNSGYLGSGGPSGCHSLVGLMSRVCLVDLVGLNVGLVVLFFIP